MFANFCATLEQHLYNFRTIFVQRLCNTCTNFVQSCTTFVQSWIAYKISVFAHTLKAVPGNGVLVSQEPAFPKKNVQLLLMKLTGKHRHLVKPHFLVPNRWARMGFI